MDARKTRRKIFPKNLPIKMPYNLNPKNKTPPLEFFTTLWTPYQEFWGKTSDSPFPWIFNT